MSSKLLVQHIVFIIDILSQIDLKKQNDLQYLKGQLQDNKTVQN